MWAAERDSPMHSHQLYAHGLEPVSIRRARHGSLGFEGVKSLFRVPGHSSKGSCGFE